MYISVHSQNDEPCFQKINYSEPVIEVSAKIKNIVEFAFKYYNNADYISREEKALVIALYENYAKQFTNKVLDIKNSAVDRFDIKAISLIQDLIKLSPVENNFLKQCEFVYKFYVLKRAHKKQINHEEIRDLFTFNHGVLFKSNNFLIIDKDNQVTLVDIKHSDLFQAKYKVVDNEVDFF